MSAPYHVKFSTQSTSVIAEVQSLDQIDAAIAALKLRRDRPVLVLIGGASRLSPADYQLVEDVFETVLSPLAQQYQAAVIDGGTDTGVMRLMGHAKHRIEGTFPLIGVSPIGLAILPNQPALSEAAAPLEPHHSHFLLVPGSDWGDESYWLAAIATEIAKTAPSVTVLINGGEVTWEDASQNVLAARSLIVLDGTGRTANLLAAGLRGEPTDDRAIPLIESGLVQSINLADLEQLRSAIETIFKQSSIPCLIKVAQFDRDFAAIAAVRTSVFQIEQGVSAALEFDGLDQAATHFLACDGDRAIGTARVRFLDGHTAKLERLAVLPNFRKHGVGRKIVETALEFLAGKNITDLRIHAQISVVAFYQKLGFVTEGEAFEEAGILHIKMNYKFP